MNELNGFEDLSLDEAMQVNGGSYVLMSVVGTIQIIFDNIMHAVGQIPLVGALIATPIQGIGDLVFNVINRVTFTAVSGFTSLFPSTATFPL
ncbi:MAG: hypothetical protein LBT44_00985 [Clostridiales bacterium]|nr:hypothetical protein [Clostridiales bacterium]